MNDNDERPMNKNNCVKCNGGTLLFVEFVKQRTHDGNDNKTKLQRR
jgi:hypothetical protein